MSATTSVMLRKASKRVITLSEIAGNNSSRIVRSTNTTWGKHTASFSTRVSSPMDQGVLFPNSTASSRSLNFSTSTPKIPDPQPLAAVAYDYDDDDDYEIDDSSVDDAHDDSRNNNSFTKTQDTTKINPVGVTSVNSDVNYVISRRNSTSSGAVKKFNNLMENQSNTTRTSSPPSSYSKFNPIFKSIHRATIATNYNGSGIGGGDGNNTINAPYPPPSSAELEGELGGKAFRKGSGGGGGGRYRCPKCGTDVTFKCDFEDNTFYCATCAGWFAGRSPIDATTTRPSNVQRQQPPSRNDGTIYEEFIAKDMRNNQQKGPSENVSEQEIIMRHVSNLFEHSFF